MINPTLSHEDGVTIFTFQRLRNTSDSQDWSFGDSHLDDCYYFMFPVGGGPVQGSDFYRHSDTPKISREKICICTFMISLLLVVQRYHCNAIHVPQKCFNFLLLRRSSRGLVAKVMISRIPIRFPM